MIKARKLNKTWAETARRAGFSLPKETFDRVLGDVLAVMSDSRIRRITAWDLSSQVLYYIVACNRCGVAQYRKHVIECKACGYPRCANCHSEHLKAVNNAEAACVAAYDTAPPLYQRDPATAEEHAHLDLAAAISNHVKHERVVSIDTQNEAAAFIAAHGWQAAIDRIIELQEPQPQPQTTAGAIAGLLGRDPSAWEELIIQLERAVDSHTMADVLGGLAEVAQLKAAHIRENWQDNRTARPWDNAARLIETTANKVRC